MPALRLSLSWVGAYLLLSAAMSWPLPLHVSTHLTGPPTGDTGVYFAVFGVLLLGCWVAAQGVVVSRRPRQKPGCLGWRAPPTA